MTATQQFSDLPASALQPDALRAGFVTPLTDMGLMAFSGADAVSFLHRQLTNDVEHLRANEARLAGYCTPQGRLLATFLLWKNGDQVVAQLPRELQDNLQKRMKMFVLRDKVTIADVSDDFVQIALGGKAAAKVLASWFDVLPEAPYAKVDNPQGILMRVADAFGVPRYLWSVPAAQIAEVWPVLAAALTAFDADAWHLADIDAGVPCITAATQEKFVAQMINFDLVGGVSFKKGCYPGQEIVARTQYLGKSRRRMLAATISLADASFAAGVDVFADNDPEQPCGTVVNVARATSDEMHCLVSLRLPVPDGVTIHVGAVNGPQLHFVPLPYELPGEAG